MVSSETPTVAQIKEINLDIKRDQKLRADWNNATTLACCIQQRYVIFNERYDNLRDDNEHWFKLKAYTFQLNLLFSLY